MLDLKFHPGLGKGVGIFDLEIYFCRLRFVVSRGINVAWKAFDNEIL